MTRTPVLLVAICLAGCAGNQATAADGPLAPLSDPSLRPYDQVTSYSTVIAVSGDAADIHLPASLSDGARLGVVVVMQGANVDKAEYGQFADGLARFGLVVIVPNHVRNVLGTNSLFTEEGVLSQAFDQVVAEGRRNGSPLFGHVDETRLAVSGHSYGGMIGLLALAGSCTVPLCTPGSYTRPQALHAGAFWGTNLGPAGLQVQVDTSNEPVALIQGSLDGKALPADGQATFQQLKNPKDYITVVGVNHYGITDEQNPPSAAADTSVQAMPQADSVLRVALAAGVFLRAHLFDDTTAASILAQMHATRDGTVTVQDDENP